MQAGITMASLKTIWRGYRQSSGWQRELITIGLCLLGGLLLVPVAIWLVGNRLLGPYGNGGLWPLLGDFLRGLAGGSSAFWVVALGPYAAVWVVRLLRRGLRG
jgi:hypothetical protein